RPIFYKGEQVGEWRHFDERLTVYLLATRRPPPLPVGARLPGGLDPCFPPDPREEASDRLETALETIEEIFFEEDHDDRGDVDGGDQASTGSEQAPRACEE
ncbi:MAG: hypothetical protein ABIS38_03795, partial [Sphingomicrobium sp.]